MYNNYAFPPKYTRNNSSFGSMNNDTSRFLIRITVSNLHRNSQSYINQDLNYNILHYIDEYHISISRKVNNENYQSN
jgi:hypothetical protein